MRLMKSPDFIMRSPTRSRSRLVLGEQLGFQFNGSQIKHLGGAVRGGGGQDLDDLRNAGARCEARGAHRTPGRLRAATCLV